MAAGGVSAMQCPKCSGEMEAVAFGLEIEVMRCSGCGGIFCQRQALQKMRDESMADAVLDTGSAAEGSRYNDQLNTHCPGCGAPMERVQDKEQAHIMLDVCPECEGVFLDAGELTDMKSVTLMDQLRRVLTIFDR